MFPRLRGLSRLFSTSTATLNPNPETLSTSINNLFNERNLDRFVSSFKLSSNSYRFRCRHRIFDTAVGRLAAAGRHSSVKEILDFQKQFRDDFKREGELDAALKVLDVMEQNGFSPCLVSYNTLLNAFYGNNRLSDAEKIWDRMVKEKIEPDTKSFNAKMLGLVSEGKTADAIKLADELKRLKLKPNTFTFNTLIKAFCKDGNLEEAKKIYVNLTKNDCAPSRGTFDVLIPSLCKAGELDTALKLCNENMSRRRLMDAPILQEVVNGLVKGSSMEKAKKLVDLARQNGYSKKNVRMP